LHSPPFPASDEQFLFRVIQAAFGKRRKTLKNALANSRLGFDEARVLRALQSAEIDPRRRAETLDVQEFVRLANLLKE
jgi:16S rRNA (adenine1518-N6/adenine1519-N6)-dimethyltransferase